MDDITGSNDPLNENKPVYTAVMFAILFNLLGGGTLAAALFTNYWFTTNTGARMGLRTSVLLITPPLTGTHTAVLPGGARLGMRTEVLPGGGCYRGLGRRWRHYVLSGSVRISYVLRGHHLPVL